MREVRRAPPRAQSRLDPRLDLARKCPQSGSTMRQRSAPRPCATAHGAGRRCGCGQPCRRRSSGEMDWAVKRQETAKNRPWCAPWVPSGAGPVTRSEPRCLARGAAPAPLHNAIGPTARQRVQPRSATMQRNQPRRAGLSQNGYGGVNKAMRRKAAVGSAARRGVRGSGGCMRTTTKASN